MVENLIKGTQSVEAVERERERERVLFNQRAKNSHTRIVSFFKIVEDS